MKKSSSPQPAATPSLPADAAPSLAWRYPFQSRQRTEVSQPQTFYGAFSQMDDGFFPLGVNGFPHGGVHFGQATAGALHQADGVRCIADGEIVAYKLDDRYPHLHFTQSSHWALYSTGFVLVRHTLMLPADSSGTASPDDTQTIYSLSMHMADWSTYLADGAVKRPGWWIGVEAFRIGDADRQNGVETKGARVRTEPKAAAHGRYAAGQLVGFLPEGSEVRIGEKRGAWGHITSIKAGAMVSAESGGAFGDDDLNGPWHRPDGAPATTPVTPAGDWGWIYLHDQHAVTEPVGVGSVVIPPQPMPVKAGTLLGQLGEYIDFERSSPLPPVPVRQLLHLEVFADDHFPAWLERSRARAAQLPADQKTVLVINAGATLVQSVPPAERKLSDIYPLHHADLTASSPASGPWVQVQPRYLEDIFVENDGPPVWIRRDDLSGATARTPAWGRFPLQLQAAAAPANGMALIYSRAQLDALDARDKTVNDQGVHWWQLTFPTSDGESTMGWVCEANHPGTSWESPWAWPGFEIVDATDVAITDAFERNLVVTSAAEGLEALKYQDAMARVDASPMFQRLAQTLSKYIKRDARGKPQPAQYPVNARIMQQSMAVPWLASDLSNLILRYESEWGGNMDRWEAITPLMRNARENWECELGRIRKLQWWEDVKGKVDGFPSDPAVYHIHPIALIGNFFKNSPRGNSKFPSDIIAAAQEAQTKWGVPASVSLAQWAFESGYGRHMPPTSNNPFGIKASAADIANGDCVNAMTTEVVRGERVHVSQRFRKFASMTEAFDYHGRLLATHGAYSKARSKLPDALGFADGLTGHYATEPNYGQKLIDGYMKPNNLTQYDSPQACN